MEVEDKLLKKKIGELNELKATVDSIRDMYAEKLTTYALMTGDNNLQRLTPQEQGNYNQRKKYQQLSEMLQNVIIKKIDSILC